MDTKKPKKEKKREKQSAEPKEEIPEPKQEPVPVVSAMSSSDSDSDDSGEDEEEAARLREVAFVVEAVKPTIENVKKPVNKPKAATEVKADISKRKLAEVASKLLSESVAPETGGQVQEKKKKKAKTEDSSDEEEGGDAGLNLFSSAALKKRSKK